MPGRYLDVELGDPYSNLALEEAIFRVNGPPTLRVWENQTSVVLGRAQLPGMETDLTFCKAEAIPVVRRFTAGGAVYNGPGNLNWSFFVPKRSTHRKLVFSDDARRVFARFGSIVVDALLGCGVECAFQPPNRIVTASGKISGMAAYVSASGTLCHGTLLLHADLDRLARVTTPSGTRAERKYTRSRFAVVANAATSRGAFVSSVLKAAELDSTPAPPTREELGLAGNLTREKYSREEWNLGDPFESDYL